MSILLGKIVKVKSAGKRVSIYQQGLDFIERNNITRISNHLIYPNNITHAKGKVIGVIPEIGNTPSCLVVFLDTGKFIMIREDGVELLSNDDFKYYSNLGASKPEFQYVSSNSPENLTTKVQGLLDDGWLLKGIVTNSKYKGFITFHVMMIRGDAYHNGSK